MSTKHPHNSELETQVEEAMVQGEQFLEKHLRKILIGMAGVVVVAAGIFAYVKLVKEPGVEKASAAMYVAEDRFISGQDSLALVGEGLNSKGFEAIIKEHSGTDAANLSYAYSGISLYETGKYQEALEALKQFSSKDEYVAPSIQRLIGDCYAQLGQIKEAASAYEKAASMADNEAITPSCLLKAGYAYEKLGEAKKALDLYQSIKTKYYTSVEAQTIEADIIRATAAIK